MANLSYSQMQEVLNSADLVKLPPFHIVILRNIMVEPIVPILRYFAYEMGYNASVSMGQYDNILQEAISSKNLINIDTDCIIVCAKLENLSWDIARNFTALSEGDINAECERIRDFITTTLSGIRKKTNGIIIWHGFEMPAFPAYGIRDSQVENGQVAVVQGLNAFVRNYLRETGNAYFVDLALSQIRLGIKNFYDHRYWNIGRAPYTREALQEIAAEDAKLIRSLKGKTRKCLVLDCDEVLWGGIIGEDGLTGIKLGKGYPGCAYLEFQQEVVSLFHRGVILALCSKNNEADVWEVFRKHPEMLIKEEHIATAQINWRDKAENLRQIASDLNIGLDHLVFADDSDYEIGLINQVLPEVATLHLAKERAAEYRDMLASCGLFDTIDVSEEDKQRGIMYREEFQRKKIKNSASNLEDYLASLEMVAEVRLADDYSAPRLAQLTQKTNQFNLTTRRYSLSDIQSFMLCRETDVLSLSMSDRFGNMGLVGVCILKYTDTNAIIDTFLLSCRVLGRGVDDIFLGQAMRLAKRHGSKSLIGLFRATRKNKQVENFYEERGFVEKDELMDGFDKVMQFDLTREIVAEQPYFVVKSILEEEAIK